MCGPEDHPLWRKILGNIRQSTLRVQMERQNLNSARADVLQEFLRFGHQECPADRYVIFFYGHAYGPMGLFYDTDANRRDANTLRLNDLAGSMHAVDGRASIVVFRDCFMNTLETAFQLRGIGEFMIASQSVAPIAGIWPWLNFMTALMPSAESGEVARALAIQLARFLDEPANRGPFADVPIALLDLGETGGVIEPLKALADALDEARRDPARCRACANALEAARVGYPSDPSNPGDPALLDVPTMCDNLEQLGSDPVAGPARALGDLVRNRLVRWHHSQMGRYQGTSIYYKPVTAKDLERSYIQAGIRGRCGDRCGGLHAPRAERGDGMAPRRAESARRLALLLPDFFFAPPFRFPPSPSGFESFAAITVLPSRLTGCGSWRSSGESLLQIGQSPAIRE